MSGRRVPSRPSVRDSRRGRRWGALRVEGAAEAVEILAGLLSGRTLGCEWLEGGAGARFYFDDPAAARAALEAAREPRAGADGRLRLSVETVEDAGWVEAYRATLTPFDVAGRFRVVPGAGAGLPGTGEGRTEIRITPGRAFGTGEHATTRLCAMLLEAAVRPGSRWLDVGCGTGILAVVAHHCGAADVEAVDLDPEAVEVAREVLEANGLAGKVRVAVGSLERAAGSEARDGIVANVELGFHLAEAPRLHALLRPGGILIASGFLVRDVPEVQQAMRDAGLAPQRSETEAPWAALAARRGDG